MKHYIPEIGKYSKKHEPQGCGNWLNHQSNVCTRLHHEIVEKFCLLPGAEQSLRHVEGWRPCIFLFTTRWNTKCGIATPWLRPPQKPCRHGEIKTETYVTGMTLPRNNQRHYDVWMTSLVGLNLKVPFPSTPLHQRNKRKCRATRAANKRTTPRSQQVCLQEGREGKARPTKWLLE